MSLDELKNKLYEIHLKNSPAGKAKEIIHNVLNSSLETRKEHEGIIKIISEKELDISKSLFLDVLKEEKSLYKLQLERIKRLFSSNDIYYEINNTKLNIFTFSIK